MNKIAKNQIESALKTLAAPYALYVPVRGAFTHTPESGMSPGSANASQFLLYEEGLPLHWETNTCLSPKDLFFPQTEAMYTVSAQGKSVEIQEEPFDNKPTILFGVRSCDMESIDCMDRVFLQKGFEDAYYKNRREKTVIFALSCSTHDDACFCVSMGIDPQASPAADVQINDLGGAFGFTAQTPKGEQALAHIVPLLSAAAGTAGTSGNTPVPAAPMRITVDAEGVSEKLETMFEHPLWNDLCLRCLGCGVCTFVCPTCYCFDINNKTLSHTATGKLRCWDSCMYKDYSEMAGGHNPRPTKKERVRNRFMDKLLYNRQRHGRVFCVGCGRCVAKCPVNLEIATTIQKIQAAEVKST
jgi:ferredoxin